MAFHLSSEEIIGRIRESTGLSDSDIAVKIDAKLSQLAGLISRDGAAHIVATELGVKFPNPSGGKLKIRDVAVGMRSVEVVGKVVRVFEVREFKRSDATSGKVGSFVFGDDTGSIRVTCWGGGADAVSSLSDGAIVKVSGGYVRENRGSKEIHLNDQSSLVLNPPGEVVGEVKAFAKAVRKSIKDLANSDDNVEILGTVVQVFDPRFFETCPNCGKRVRDSSGAGFSCEVHNIVVPAYSYVMNAYVDDGSDNIRVVFFKVQAQRFTGKSDEEFVSFKNSPELFEQVKTDLLGLMVRLVGKSQFNEMFNRKEFVAQLVFPNPDAKEELSRLESDSVKSNE